MYELLKLMNVFLVLLLGIPIQILTVPLTNNYSAVKFSIFNFYSMAVLPIIV